MNKSNYTWLDKELFEQAQKAFQILVDMMQRNGGTWKPEWLKNIAYDRRNEIFNDLFDEVCNEYGFDKRPLSIVGVTGAVGIDPDQRVVAKAEAKKRFRGIERFFEELASNPTDMPSLGGWLLVHYDDITSHIGEIVSIKDGVPTLVADWKKRLQELCTHTIHEDYRPLCDLLRNNESVCYGLIEAGDKAKLFAPWSFAFDDNGKFSLSDFGRVVR